VLVLGVAAAACRQPMSKGAVQVRLRNETGMALKEAWLGPGGRGDTSEAYGPIAAGETTEYRGLQPFLERYRTLDYVGADGKAHGLTVSPEQHLGMRELLAGRYTFVLTPPGTKPALRIIEEPRY
jgi:hypothetical protein